jgi:hypothetical protein
LGSASVDDLYLRPFASYENAGIELMLDTRVRAIG